MERIFVELKSMLAKFEQLLAVQKDEPGLYTLVTKKPSPFLQHKGQPMFFGSVRVGKAYVSYHLMPIYMCEPLQKLISKELKKRMQDKACFNFRAAPEPALITELQALTEASWKRWSEQNWA